MSVGWREVGDLTRTGPDKELMKQRVASCYPGAKPGAIPVWAGVLLRFAYEMQVGDFVIYPYRPDSTLNFGRVEGPYYYDSAADLHPNRRQVTWLKTAVPRTLFSKSARYEVGSAVTMFRVKNHADEFLSFILDRPGPAASGPIVDSVIPVDVAATNAEDEPNADRLETYTRDFVVEALHKGIDGVRFEYFVAHLLHCMGYRTQVTPASGDGGVDVIAHKDPLGLEPPIIKVQCKKTLHIMGTPDVQKLVGALASRGTELGLFVTLGTYSKDAMQLERNRQDLRLIDGNELVSLVLEYYDRFSPEWKRFLPLRRVYLVDRDPEAT